MSQVPQAAYKIHELTAAQMMVVAGQNMQQCHSNRFAPHNLMYGASCCQRRASQKAHRLTTCCSQVEGHSSSWEQQRRFFLLACSGAAIGAVQAPVHAEESSRQAWKLTPTVAAQHRARERRTKDNNDKSLFRA